MQPLTVREMMQDFWRSWQGAEPSIRVFTIILLAGLLIVFIAAYRSYKDERRNNAEFLNTVWLYKRRRGFHHRRRTANKAKGELQ